jgi:hypothetical protein
VHPLKWHGETGDIRRGVTDAREPSACAIRVRAGGALRSLDALRATMLAPAGSASLGQVQDDVAAESQSSGTGDLSLKSAGARPGPVCGLDEGLSVYEADAVFMGKLSVSMGRRIPRHIRRWRDSLPGTRHSP